MKLLLSVIVASLLGMCGTTHNPAVGNQVTTRNPHPGAVFGHKVYPDTMMRYFDSPPNTWYDLDGRIWTYDGKTWKKL